MNVLYFLYMDIMYFFMYGSYSIRLRNRCVPKGEATTLSRNSVESFIPLHDNISFAVWISYIQIRGSVLARRSLWNSVSEIPHIYSIGWKYFFAHQKIASTTFERTWSCTDFYEIENFNIKYLCREQKLRLPLRLELNANAYLSAKTRLLKVIYACTYACFSYFVSKIIYVSNLFINMNLNYKLNLLIINYILWT